MTPADISQYLGVVLGGIALLGHAKGYFSSGEKALGTRLEKTEKALIEHDRRIQRVEDELKHLPDKDTVMELKLALAELKGTVNALGETVGSVSRTVHRIDDYLRQKAEA
ncbi:DUF2730 family protein [Sinorhizobium medicae]|uniref:DUF2730 family protein n=1 Tax=Sinorhizobium medicae TaxID=110321 RepID=UPI000FDBD48D|nr:DUF2730 family protein [Sinorhizobium medicae]RVJ42364.1 DUF2730 family protein [Sinorhizobium medicae]